MKAGDTFLYPLQPPNTEHLWIVATNPNADGAVLIVNVTTMHSFDKDHIDGTVCLNQGEHIFLTEKHSYVYYRGAQIKKISELENEKSAGMLKPQPPCSKTVIDLVRSGFNASEHCQKGIRRFYEQSKNL
jgi:hypothetical protein